MPQIIFPAPVSSSLDSPEFGQWFELARKYLNTPPLYSQSTDPGVAGVPAGTYSMWKNTTSGLVKLWVNDGGVMKSVTLT